MTRMLPGVFVCSCVLAAQVAAAQPAPPPVPPAPPAPAAPAAPDFPAAVVVPPVPPKPFPLAALPPIPPMPPLPAVTADPATLQHGAQLYTRYCMVCHGAAAVAGAGIPDLRHSAYLQSADAFRRPPLEGLLEGRGMPSFAGSLDREAIDSIRAYVIHSARDTSK